MRTALAVVLMLLAVVGVANVACQSPAGGGGNTGTADTSNDPPTTNDDDTAPSETVVDPVLPSDVSLDIDELPEDSDTQTAKPMPSGQTATRVMYEHVVRSSATVVHRFHRLANQALALGARLHYDITEPDQTQVRGTFVAEGIEVAYKADFAAFDIDSNGVPDGSGNAVDLPIAIRIWTDMGRGYERLLCALITEKPSEVHLGAGTIHVRPDAAIASAPAGVQIRVEYDRTDPTHKWNVAYVSGRIHPRHELSIGTARVDVRSPDSATIEKTVRAAYRFAENLYGFESFRSAAHYVRGGVGLLLTAKSTGGLVQVDFDNVCTNIETQALATDGECDAFDLQDMTLLDAPTGNETDFPSDFPEEPTF